LAARLEKTPPEDWTWTEVDTTSREAVNDAIQQTLAGRKGIWVQSPMKSRMYYQGIHKEMVVIDKMELGKFVDEVRNKFPELPRGGRRRSQRKKRGSRRR
jgi:hypothetical protein